AAAARRGRLDRLNLHRRVRRSPARPLAVMAATLLPTVLLAWYLGDPAHNHPIVIRLEHFVITSNVSVVAALVAFLVARAALGVGHYRALLIALGFASMAAIFAVHGLATPGVLEQGDREAPAQLVLGVSAELALAVAAVFFAVRYTSLAAWLERRLRAEILTVAVVAFLGLYAFVGLGWPAEFTGIARWILASGGAAAGYQPSAYGYGIPAGGDVTGGGGWVPRRIVAPGLERLLPATAAQGVDSCEPLRLAGERQTVTSLCSDLRGSTSLAERLTPEQTIAAVNSYLRVMARCVLDNGGILDKFTGDGVMAIFGAMTDPTNGALAAVRAALAMRKSIGELNAERAARGEVVVQFGLGLHTGDVVLGAIGLPERSQYDAIGDAVHL